MKIVVLGAGVIGVTTAYYLARQGHAVTVIDRESGPALETSYANAGQVSYGYSSPWAAPGVPLKALKWMFAEHPPLKIRPDGSVFQLRWIFDMWRNCTPARYTVNKERLVRLSEYSRECLHALRDATGIQYEGRSLGTLQVFRTQRQLDDVDKDVAVLKEAGIAYELLGANELARIEPGLAHCRSALAGGLRLPEDETGDCHLFTRRLTELARESGAAFRFDTPVTRLLREGDTILGVQCGDAIVEADATVVALGSWSTPLMEGMLRLPVYPLKGYSITVPILDAARAPVSTLLDESYKVALTRFEDRIRVGGMAEIAGYDRSLDPRRRATLEMVLDDLFPSARTPGQVSFWTGLRPKTPDSTPIVGATPLRNLYLNTGHGTLGWTMACGSGQLLADIVSGRQPAIRHDDLSIARYGA